MIIPCQLCQRAYPISIITLNRLCQAPMITLTPDVSRSDLTRPAGNAVLSESWCRWRCCRGCGWQRTSRPAPCCGHQTWRWPSPGSCCRSTPWSEHERDQVMVFKLWMMIIFVYVIFSYLFHWALPFHTSLNCFEFDFCQSHGKVQMESCIFSAVRLSSYPSCSRPALVCSGCFVGRLFATILLFQICEID